MKKDELITRYLDLMHQKAESCNKQLHQSINQFALLSLFFYVVVTFNIENVSILGIDAKLPKSLIIGAAPFILTYLLYSITSFECLEDVYYGELMRVISTLSQEAQYPLERWQYKILETPSYYTYSEVQFLRGSRMLFGKWHLIIRIIFLIFYTLLPPLIIGYFIWTEFIILQSSWIFLLYIPIIPIAIYATFQVFETFRDNR